MSDSGDRRARGYVQRLNGLLERERRLEAELGIIRDDIDALIIGAANNGVRARGLVDAGLDMGEAQARGRLSRARRRMKDN